MRSMVEGASDSPLHLGRTRLVEVRAPSTTFRSLRELQVVPLPRFAGADELTFLLLGRRA